MPPFLERLLDVALSEYGLLVCLGLVVSYAMYQRGERATQREMGTMKESLKRTVAQFERCESRLDKLMNREIQEALSLVSDANEETRKLFNWLSSGDLFSKDDLKALCFSLGLDCEDIDDRTLSSFALGISSQARHLNKTPALLDAILQARPQLK